MDRFSTFRRASRSPLAWALAVTAAFIVARIVYIGRIGIRFEIGSLGEYLQFIDPELLRTDLARSLFYLRDQPPLFNLFLGVVLKAFPKSFELAFHAFYLALGLSGSLASFFLARRLGAGNRVAALFSVLLFAAPGTILYEHWLFYGYPVAVLVVAAALGLHRVLGSPTRTNAFLAFGALALLVLLRGTFHIAVYLATLAGLAVVRPRRVRAILMGALAPTIIACALYVKHAAVFGGVVIGDFYRNVNLSGMQMAAIGDREVKRLQEDGTIPKGCTGNTHSHSDLAALLRDGNSTVKPRGVPLLDTLWKSTGATNWHSTAGRVVGLKCAGVARVLRERYPDVYPKAVHANVDRYMLPADDAWPFQRTGQKNNADKLRSANHWMDENLALKSKDTGVSRTVKYGLVVAALSPLWFFARWIRVVRRARKRRRVGLPSSLGVAAFTSALLIYAMTVGVLYSGGDHNRYRAEIMLLVWTVAVSTVMAMVHAWWRAMRRWRRTSRERALSTQIE